MKRAVLAAAFVTLALFATALPFLPGRYDPVAMQLSLLARAVGFASLLLVPVGLVWLIREFQVPKGEARQRGAALGSAVWFEASFAACVAAVFCLGWSGPALAVCVIAAWSLLLWRGAQRFEQWMRGPREREAGAAAIFMLAPCVLVSAQLALAGKLEVFAWNRTMDGMQALIADIEAYRAWNERYPTSLFAEWADYRPEVIGVAGYLYEPSGDSYRLAVEVPNLSFDSRVFLSYDPTDRHEMASHDVYLLRRTEQEPPFYRGYSVDRTLDRPHWKVLYFD